MKTLFTLLTVGFLSYTLQAQTIYRNDQYGFEGQVPDDWIVYSEITDDLTDKRALIDWGLPKVYSKLEKAEIENAVAITAYKRTDIQNIDDLIKVEFDRVKHMLISKSPVDSIPFQSYVLITSQNGLRYKSQVVFMYKNDIGYVITFTATPGTYDANLSRFKDFLKGIQLFVPMSHKKVIPGSNKGIHFDGLYIAKTGEINIPNNKMEIYTYLRFYDDGTVYTQSVNAYDPAAVSKWFAKNGRFERKGEYKLNGTDITFSVSNDLTRDKKLEGAKTDVFHGKMANPDKIFLEIKYADGEFKGYWFEFVNAD
jgi:hypothetical protein